MPHPVGKKEGVVFRKRTLIEYQHEFSTVGSQSLDRVRESCGKVPKIAFAYIADENGSIGIENRHAGISVQHEGPLIRGVPMQFPKAPRCKPHSDSRDVFSTCQHLFRYFFLPATPSIPFLTYIESPPNTLAH